MKTFVKNFALGLSVFALSATTVLAQQPTINNFRPYDKSGVGMFESPKDKQAKFDGLKVRFGAGFTQQYQILNHSNVPDTGSAFKLKPITGGFGTAMANLNMDVQLEKGIRLNVTTYLSARHHNEAWVKGGYIQFDDLSFLGVSALDDIMNYLTIRVGHMEVNYGDAHFRRSDGGATLQNPFLENNIVDAFATEIGADILFRTGGFLGLVGVTNGAIKGSVDAINQTAIDKDTSKSPAFLFKVGYDDKIGDNMRLRVTGSGYMISSAQSNTLFWGDRTGSNYWMVMEPTTAFYTANAWSGRINPGMSDKVTAFQINAFFKVSGLEFFGTYETAKGRNANDKDPADVTGKTALDRSFNQLAADVLYRFGAKENVYLGARYNMVKGNFITSNITEQNISRIAVAAGWFVTENVMIKGEYVTQTYKDYPVKHIFSEGKFDGIVFEAAVGF
ncbi:MAG: hypothetical protein IPM69_14325 [Ignavibacteria bacterium]|nr:hypothetical protein [Ignavibacteria bacterium]